MPRVSGITMGGVVVVVVVVFRLTRKLASVDVQTSKPYDQSAFFNRHATDCKTVEIRHFSDTTTEKLTYIVIYRCPV